MAASISDEGGAPNPLRCGGCSAALAHDQRYCVECGERRGPLPRNIAERIGTVLEQGRELEAPGSATEEHQEHDGRRFGPIGRGLPSPRAAAVGVLSMLSFGVLVGSLVTGSIASPVSRPSIIVHLGNHGSSGSNGGGGGGSSGSGGAASGSSSGSSSSSSSSPAASSSSTASSTGSSSDDENNSGSDDNGFNGLPPVQHVWLIVLSQQGYNQTFAPNASDHYLNSTLLKQGELLPNYYAVAGSPLANEIAILSGQGPTAQTEEDCPKFTKITPGIAASDHQVLGTGCVYPSSTKTLMSQLTKAHDTWKAYIGGIGKGQATACEHPKFGASAVSHPTVKDPYTYSSNPFLYFDSILGSSACKQADVGLGQLKADLQSTSTTPTFSYVAPGACQDGSDTPCAKHAPDGLGPADAFLKTTVEEIRQSPAYKAGGMIAITFDQAPQTGPDADSSSCCSNPTYPNLPVAASTPTTTTTSSTTTTAAPATTTTPSATTTTTTPTTTTPTTTTPTTTTPSDDSGDGDSNPTGGGGLVGMLLLSPWVKANTSDTLDYFDHFSLLAGVEELLGLGKIGYAGASGLIVWGSFVFNGTGPSS